MVVADRSPSQKSWGGDYLRLVPPVFRDGAR